MVMNSIENNEDKEERLKMMIKSSIDVTKEVTSSI
jgi:hypothetical protein